jgi:hypothetical protein
MAFYFLWESIKSSATLPEQEMRKFLELYGRRKSHFIYGPVSSDIHCGTDYRVLRDWMFDRNVAADSDAKDFWGKESNGYKYVFVFHECKIPDGATDDEIEKKIVGCSFHPPVFISSSQVHFA